MVVQYFMKFFRQNIVKMSKYIYLTLKSVLKNVEMTNF